MLQRLCRYIIWAVPDPRGVLLDPRGVLLDPRDVLLDPRGVPCLRLGVPFGASAGIMVAPWPSWSHDPDVLV